MALPEYFVMMLASVDAAALAPFRTEARWEALENGDALWVRGPVADLERTRVLPCRQRYVSYGSALCGEGMTIPTAKMPAGPWHPVADIVVPALPSFQLPAKAPGIASISLHRSDAEQTPSALLVDWEFLSHWAEMAPARRLEALRFAAAAHGEALAIGNPLPPLPGKAFHTSGRLLLPCGYELAPHVWPDYLQRRLALDPGDWALVLPDASVTLIPATAIHGMSRSALRLTAPGMALAQIPTEEEGPA